MISLLQNTAQQSSFGMLIMFIPLILIFYFLILRPQKKEQKRVQDMLSALKKGDKIVTIGGIYGTVSSTREKSVIIKVDENCKIEVNRNAIQSVVNSVDAPVQEGIEK